MDRNTVSTHIALAPLKNSYLMIVFSVIVWRDIRDLPVTTFLDT